MEERIIDDPRKIKVKRNASGGVEDATDDLAAEQPEGEEEELLIDLPEEYDEDLVGLSPSQLEEALARRKKEEEEARAEHDRLLALGEEALSRGEYSDAEPLFRQALLYDGASLAAQRGLFASLTENFKTLEPLYEEENVNAFSAAEEETKAYVRERAGDRFREERARAEEEAAPLRERVTAAQQERRRAFRDNRNYYRLRLGLFGGIFFLMIFAVAVSGQFIVRVNDLTPVIVVSVFAALALVALVPTVIYLRKFVVAQRLCRENEILSSTEEGARLEELEAKLEALAILLG